MLPLPFSGTQPSTGTDTTSETSKAGINQIQLFIDHFAWYLDLLNLYAKHSWSFLIQAPRVFVCVETAVLPHPSITPRDQEGRPVVIKHIPHHPTSFLICPVAHPASQEKESGGMVAGSLQAMIPILSPLHWEPVSTWTSCQENSAPQINQHLLKGEICWVNSPLAAPHPQQRGRESLPGELRRWGCSPRVLRIRYS